MATNVDTIERYGHGIKVNCKYNGIEFIISASVVHTVFVDICDWFFAYVDKINVIKIVSLKVMGIEADALSADGLILGRENLCSCRVLHGFADLAANKIGS